VEGPQGAKLRALIFPPTGTGPFPVVVVLHGASGGLLSGGFRQEVLDWGPDLARAGFVTVVGFYFRSSNRLNLGNQFGEPCPQAPYLPNARVVENVIALMDAGRRVPGARRDQVALVGWSTGGRVAVVMASSGADVQAVVSVSGSFNEELPGMENFPFAISLVQSLRPPLLILQGTNDGAVPVEDAREYEKRAHALGKNVQAHYYEGGTHFLFINPPFREDVVPRSVEFLNKYLRP
jgi:dienelactone hydrolase